MSAPQFVQPRRTAGRGTAALWLGILSCAICLLSLGLLALLTLALGIAALVVGLRRRQTAAAVLGGIGTLLSLLAIAFWIGLVIIGGLAIEFIDLEGWLDLPPVEDPTDPDPPII